MAINEMDARLISQGTQVESVGAEALVPVASGEGQPQSNITLANLADSLGQAVPQQQDAEQVVMTGLYAQTSDGKMVELTKESVASVMAGLMNTNKLFPFMGLGALDRSPDDITRDGTFAIMGNGFSVGLPINYGVLLCYNMGGYFASQMCSLNHDLYIRGRDNGVWKTWQRLDNFGANTKEELASMVAGVNLKSISYALKDTESSSSYNISINGEYVELFDHTCYGGGICIVSSSTSKLQLLVTNWGIKYRTFIDSSWGNWCTVFTP